MRSFRSFWPIAGLAICGFLLAGIADHAGTPQIAFADEGWRAVALPARPIYITSNADTFWVCGTDEMIARSSDGGQTWQLRHLIVDGEVLLGVRFIDEKTAYASGTNGLILWTKDGGETWISSTVGTESIVDISFGDEQHGIRHSRSAVEITSDAGATWLPISKPQTDQDLEKFKIVGGVAALDKNHFMILMEEGPYSDQIFLFTSDGGKIWKTNYVPSVGIRRLAVHDGEYWAFGMEVIEKDKPGGGHSVPLALHSRDGVRWVHGARSPKELQACTEQGCILWDGAIVDLYHEKPLLWSVPADQSLTSVWALARGTVCSVGLAVKCVSSRLVDAPPPKPETNQSVFQSVSAEPPAAGCVACNLESFSVHKDLGWKGILNLDFLVKRNGTVGEVKVQTTAPKEIESTVADRVKGWVFEPSHEKNSATTPGHASVGIECYPFTDQAEGSCSFKTGLIHLLPAGGGVIGGVIPPVATPMDPQLKADIQRLFEVQRLREHSAKAGRTLFESMRPMLLASLPPTASRQAILDAYVEKLLDLFKSDDFTDRVAASYAKYFSDDDIKALTKFYETPAGQHFNEAFPQLVGELNGAGQQLALENISRIFKELCKEYPELKGVAKFCPASPSQDKKSLLQPGFPSMRDSFTPRPTNSGR